MGKDPPVANEESLLGVYDFHIRKPIHEWHKLDFTIHELLTYSSPLTERHLAPALHTPCRRTPPVTDGIQGTLWFPLGSTCS